ncbi:hypothetical protein MMC25_004322 [Agyrium rufum]|nr:hypothetical protein [Agyrium rufum]
MYVVPPQQWLLNGSYSGGEKGKVLQFVAMPLDSGYTIEAKLTSQETVRGIQFSVIPQKTNKVPPVTHILEGVDPRVGFVVVLAQPSEQQARSIVVDGSTQAGDLKLVVWTEFLHDHDERQWPIFLSKDLQVKHRGHLFRDHELLSSHGVRRESTLEIDDPFWPFDPTCEDWGHTYGSQHRFRWHAPPRPASPSNSTLARTEMGIAREGSIEQIVILNAETFEAVTGLQAPDPPFAALSRKEPIRSTAKMDGEKKVMVVPPSGDEVIDMPVVQLMTAELELPPFVPVADLEKRLRREAI